MDYQDSFHLPGEVLSSTTAVKHESRLEPGTEPVNAKPYRLYKSQEQGVRRQVEELKTGGITTESNSPWNSPLLVVPLVPPPQKKADATGEERWRLVTDYRSVNEKTVGDAHPLPEVTEILDHLGQSKYFSCIDTVMGYNEVELAEEDMTKRLLAQKKATGKI